MKRFSLALVSLFGLVASAFAQTSYNRFGPANGVLVGDSSTFYTSAADSSDIIGLWSGTCNLSSFLRGDGTCASVTPSAFALTRVDDTNVTLTLGGSPNTSLLAATSLTLGWNGQLAVSRGGTGASSLSGLLTGNGTSPISGATSSDVIAEWTGTCNSTTFLRADGTCQTVGSGSGSVTSISQGTGIAATPNPITTTGTIAIDQAASLTWTGTETFRGQLWAYPTSGTASVRLRAATDTTQDANWIQWYRADGSTERGWLGYGSNGSDVMTLNNQLGQITLTPTGSNLVLGAGDFRPTATGSGQDIGQTSNRFRAFRGEFVDLSAAGPQLATLNATNANGPYVTLQRSGSSFADIGSARQCGSSMTIDALGLCARAGNNVEIVAGGRTAADVAVTSAGVFDVNLNATFDGTLVVDPSGGADELTVTNGAVALTGTVTLPSTTTINSQNVCLANGTNCPSSSAFAFDCTTVCNLSGMTAGQWARIRKTADTSRASTTSLNNDADLSFTNVPAGNYAMVANLYWSGGAGGVKHSWGAPSGVVAGNSILFYAQGPSAGSCQAAPFSGIASALSDGTFETYACTGLGGSVATHNFPDGMNQVRLSGTGTLALYWAQNSSNGTATVLEDGSWVTLMRIN